MINSITDFGKRRTNPRSQFSGARITCGANECYNLAISTCPLCKLEVCKRHLDHSVRYESEPIMSHSNIRRI